MTIPSLRLIRHVNSLLPTSSVTQALPAFRLSTRGQHQQPEKEKPTARVPANFRKLAEDGKWDASKFSDLPIDKRLKDALHDHGFCYMSPLQQDVIPELLKRKSVFLMDETGSGKTLSYLLPIINAAYIGELNKSSNTDDRMYPSVVILTSSQGNGYQIYTLIRTLIRDPKVHVKMKLEFGKGGRPSNSPDSPTSKPQTQSFLQSGCDVYISSPVRLQEKIDERTLSLKRLKVLVLDDLGQCLEKPLYKALKKLHLGKRSQLVMASAVVDKLLANLTPSWLLRFEKEEMSVPKAISQRFQLATGPPLTNSRLQSLLEVLEKMGERRGVIFCNRIDVVKCLESELYHRGFKTTPYHSMQDSDLRRQSKNLFIQKESQIFVATAMACCIDLPDVDFVINYELPFNVYTYLHQIGRCGRMGRPGIAVTFASREDVLDRSYFKWLSKAGEKFWKQTTLYSSKTSRNVGIVSREREHRPNSDVEETEKNGVELDKTQSV